MQPRYNVFGRLGGPKNDQRKGLGAWSGAFYGSGSSTIWYVFGYHWALVLSTIFNLVAEFSPDMPPSTIIVADAGDAEETVPAAGASYGARV